MQLQKALPRALSVFVLTTFLSAAEAVEKVLCIVTNDVDSSVGKLVYEMDEDGRGIKHLYIENWVNNKFVDRSEIDMMDVNGDGIILHKKDKYVTVRLYSHNFDEERGGVLYLDTLYNALKGERREYTIEVSKNLKNEIEMSNNKIKFSNMRLIGKKAPIVGVIGIEKVNFSK